MDARLSISGDEDVKFGADFLHPEFKKFVLAFNPALAAAPISPAPPADK